MFCQVVKGVDFVADAAHGQECSRFVIVDLVLLADFVKLLLPGGTHDEALVLIVLSHRSAGLGAVITVHGDLELYHVGPSARRRAPIIDLAGPLRLSNEQVQVQILALSPKHGAFIVRHLTRLHHGGVKHQCLLGVHP